MKHGCKAVLSIALYLSFSFLAVVAHAQHRYHTEALVGINRIPFVVTEREPVEDIWRRLGFRLKPAKQGDGSEFTQIKLKDGAGLDLLVPSADDDDTSARLREQLALGEGPAALSFYGRDLGLVAMALGGTPFEYGSVSGTINDKPGLAYLSFVNDSRADNDGAWLQHPNGATALSRVWISDTRRNARDLRQLLELLAADVTGAKVYAPEAVQSTVAAVVNGEVLILPPDRQLAEDRPVVGVTFEVESLDVLRRRLTDMGIQFSSGGAFDASLIVAPEVTHGLWVEFRE